MTDTQATLETGFNFSNGSSSNQQHDGVNYKFINMTLFFYDNKTSQWEIFSQIEFTNTYSYHKAILINRQFEPFKIDLSYITTDKEEITKVIAGLYPTKSVVLWSNIYVLVGTNHISLCNHTITYKEFIEKY